MENIHVAILLSFLFLGLCDDVTPAQNQTLQDISNETNISKQNQTQDTSWDLINLTTAEDQCLYQARAYAVEQGYPAFTVYSCTCTLSETESRKLFYCTIKAMDGKHEVDVDCKKQDRLCEFKTEEGIMLYTFDELENLVLNSS